MNGLVLLIIVWMYFINKADGSMVNNRPLKGNGKTAYKSGTAEVLYYYEESVSEVLAVVMPSVEKDL